MTIFCQAVNDASLFVHSLTEQTPKATDETQAFDLARFHMNTVPVWTLIAGGVDGGWSIILAKSTKVNIAIQFLHLYVNLSGRPDAFASFFRENSQIGEMPHGFRSDIKFVDIGGIPMCA